MDLFERHPYLWFVRTTGTPIVSRSQAAAFATRLRSTGGRIVFTNGVFDLLHPGHIRYLDDARALGDALIVGINSDRSVRANKGPSRPITPEDERAEVVAALRSVDGVILFDEETPHALIDDIQPDVLVKGADWSADTIVGRDIVEARGGAVVRVELTKGFSSTRLIEKVRGAGR